MLIVLQFESLVVKCADLKNETIGKAPAVQDLIDLETCLTNNQCGWSLSIPGTGKAFYITGKQLYYPQR